MAFSRKDWAENKAKIALELAKGGCGGGYGEAVLILCATISAIAAEIWPGRGIDQRRFVETLVRFGNIPEGPSTISAPLLYASLKNSKEKETIRKTFLNFPYGRILLGSDVDQSESKIQAVCPTLPLKDLRSFSYANLLYKLIRSPYTHEYSPDENACPFPMTIDKSAGISYVNRLLSLQPNSGYRHLICFHLPWLADLVVSIGQQVDTIAPYLPLPTSRRWWLDG